MLVLYFTRWHSLLRIEMSNVVQWKLFKFFLYIYTAIRKCKMVVTSLVMNVDISIWCQSPACTYQHSNRFNIYATRKRSIDIMPIPKLNVLNVQKKNSQSKKQAETRRCNFEFNDLNYSIFENSDFPHEGKYQMGCIRKLKHIENTANWNIRD